MKINDLPTPCYVVDEGKLIKNLEILHRIEVETGAKILLAQKCFSGYFEYGLISRYISGATASGLYEAKLGFEEMVTPNMGTKDIENHVFSPAYRDDDIRELVDICDHIVFNSVSQLRKHISFVRDSVNRKGNPVSVGIRINPECSTQTEHAIYDPCASGSRMGIRICDLSDEIIELVDGLHFHTLCEQNSDDLETTLKVVEERFGPYLHKVKWLNMGGGHHITRDDYDIDRLIRLILHMKEEYNLEIYLEPGEAVALNAGLLVTEVMDVVSNDIDILITDASAACHMPDVLEMPYRPPVMNSGEPGEKAFTYRLAGNTCLAGDVIGDYSFDEPKTVGNRIYLEDMAIYSFVKNNTFNGIPLPAIASMDEDGECTIVREFGYDDFKGRLG